MSVVVIDEGSVIVSLMASVMLRVRRRKSGQKDKLAEKNSE